jgi:hypothetical protein
VKSDIKPIGELCRTIRGQRYPAFDNWSTADDISRYRAAGVRCRKWRDVLYIHEADQAKALDIYEASHA